jgi:hypothetical protein
MITRVLPEGSWLEIADYKKRLNAELRARAYFYEKRGYIVSAVSGIAEAGEPTILPPDVANSDLGCWYATTSSSSVSNPQLTCVV